MSDVFHPEDLAAWSCGRWEGTPDAITGIDHDTRRLRPGVLYIALRGERHDGHAFVPEAFRAGAAAAMVEATWPAPAGVGPLLRVDDTKAGLARLARGHRRRLTGLIIAITGSVGKTTVKELVATVLESAGSVARTPGNWNNDIGVPLALLRMTPKDRFGVFELAMNHPGELDPLCDLVRHDWAVITRIGPVHIEFFPDERAIAEEKATLLRRMSPQGCAILAADEPWFDLLRERTAGRVVAVAVDRDADYIGSFTGNRPGELRVRERSGLVAEYPLPHPGVAMRANVLRAVALARELGVPPDRIAAALRAFQSPPMRWQPVCVNGILWINDAYNANPVSMREALRTFADWPVEGRRWLVLGGMRELGIRSDREHEALGRDLAGGPWAGLITVGTLGERIARAAAAAGTSLWVSACTDAVTAARQLAERIREGDAVLLKGSRAERVERVLEEWRARFAADAGEAPGARGTVNSE